MTIEDERKLDEMLEEVSISNIQNLFTMLEYTIDDIYSSDYDEDTKEKLRDRLIAKIKEEV